MVFSLGCQSLFPGKHTSPAQVLQSALDTTGYEGNFGGVLEYFPSSSWPVTVMGETWDPGGNPLTVLKQTLVFHIWPKNRSKNVKKLTMKIKWTINPGMKKKSMIMILGCGWYSNSVFLSRRYLIFFFLWFFSVKYPKWICLQTSAAIFHGGQFLEVRKWSRTFPLKAQ